MKRILGVGTAIAVLAVMFVTTAVPVGAAEAAHTVHADFAAGNSVYDNVVSTNDDLRVANIENLVGDWYRGHFDGTDWQVDVNKDSAGSLWAPDTCLPISSNPWSNTDRSTIGSGHTYRAGPANSGVYELGLAPGKISPPVNVMEASAIRFITHGAKVDDSGYVITVERDGQVDLVYTVTIPGANISARNGSGLGIPGGLWTRVGIPNFTGDSKAGCLGDGADEVVVNLPTGSKVVSIDFSYPTEAAPGPDGAWLGGPIAVSMVTNEDEIDRTFDWTGTYRSSDKTDTAVRSDNGGQPLWHEVDWLSQAFGSESEAELYVRCGSDTSNDGTISGHEWKDFNGVGGKTGPDVWQGPILLHGANPVGFADCTGTYLQYRVEFFPMFNVSPRIYGIFFTYNPNADADGYHAEPGDGLVDCNDNDASLNHDNIDGDDFTSCQGDCDDFAADVFPGAAVQPGDVEDGIDRDCNGFEECFADSDMDGQGEAILTSDDGNLICEASAGESSNADDCDDSRADVYKGNPTLVAGDGHDQDCTNGEECWRNFDGDPYGIEEFVDESPDPGNVCEVGDGEAVPQPGDLFDCDDTNAGVHPGVVGDRNNCRNPTGVDDIASTTKGVAVTIDVLANDIDPTDDPLIVASGTVTQPANGSVAIAAGGIKYTPDPEFAGVDAFFYKPTDGIHQAPDHTLVQVFVSVALPTAICDGKPVTIDMNRGASGTGTAGDDVILGTPFADVIDAGAGDDTVCAGDGDDSVVGGDGNDRLLGEGGRDIMRGNPGADVLLGGDGNDRLLGGIDGDTLDGGPGDDYLGGFGGDDMIIGGPGNEVIWGGFGADAIDGGSGNDQIHGLIGNDSIDGGLGNDTIDGDRGNDTINGGPGNDVIRGGNANDVLNGDAGDDNISGGKADDTLSGGLDTDTCTGNLHNVGDTTDGTCETIFGVP